MAPARAVDLTRSRPDLILGAAVGAISFAPATYGLSLLLSLPVFVAAGMALDRAARRGEPESSRLRAARNFANPVFLIVALPVAGYLLVVLPLTMLRDAGLL